jgi:hypothetical protein
MLKRASSKQLKLHNANLAAFNMDLIESLREIYQPNITSVDRERFAGGNGRGGGNSEVAKGI